MEKFKKSLLLPLVSIFALSGCAFKNKVDIAGNNSQQQNFVNHDDGVETGKIFPVENVVIEEGCFHTKLQMAYINSSYDTVTEFANGLIDKSNPTGNTIAFTKTGGQLLQVSSFEDYHEDEATPYLDTRKFEITNHEKANIKNLLNDTTYYWRTFDNLKGEGEPLEEGSFKTCNHLPRFIDIDDKKANSKYVTNVRDMGGYETYLPGYTKVKQGYIYRSGRMSGSVTCTPNPGQVLHDFDEPTDNDSGQAEMLCSATGFDMLTKTLGMKGEIDLRNDCIKVNYDSNGNPSSYYVENGNRDKYPDTLPGINCITPGIFSEKSALLQDLDDIGLTSGYAQIKEAFTFYANPENFPNFVHCYIGTDRTGCVCYLLECILGMSNADMYKDYLWSNFGLIGGSRDMNAIKTYERVLLSYGKPTMAENAEALLTSSKIGITKEQIQSIRNTLLVKA